MESSFSTSVYRLVGSARAARRAPRRCLCLSVAGRCSGSGPVRFRSAGSAGSRLPNALTELSPDVLLLLTGADLIQDQLGFSFLSSKFDSQILCCVRVCRKPEHDRVPDWT